MAEKTLDAKTFAEKLGTDSKTARRFLRKQGMGVGQGNRYDIPVGSVKRLKAEFVKWQKDEAAKKAARDDKATKAKSDEKVNPVTDEEIAEETHEDNDGKSDPDPEPSEDDMQAIEDEEVPEV